MLKVQLNFEKFKRRECEFKLSICMAIPKGQKKAQVKVQELVQKWQTLENCNPRAV